MHLKCQCVNSPIFFNVGICAMNSLLTTTVIFFMLNRIVNVVYSFSLNSRKSLISSSISDLTYFSFSSVVCSIHEFLYLVFFLVLLIWSCNSWWSDKIQGCFFFYFSCMYRDLSVSEYVFSVWVSFMRWWAEGIFSYISVDCCLNISWINVHALSELEYFSV